MDESTEPETLAALPDTGAREWILYLALLSLTAGYAFLATANRLETRVRVAALKHQITQIK
ncbi:MAG: hypothetical protein KJO36_13360 [Acidimicrobiia bacterium]|nr:hypothetical protein [Acidimicrobiia bacterium]